MELTRISRSFKQTIQVKNPKDGSDVWLSHEASLEATLDDDDSQNLPECYDELEKIVKQEVLTSIKEFKDKLAASSGAAAPTGRAVPKLS